MWSVILKSLHRRSIRIGRQTCHLTVIAILLNAFSLAVAQESVFSLVQFTDELMVLFGALYETYVRY